MEIPKKFDAPSGRRLTQADIQLWCDLEDNGSFGWNPQEIRFNSGFMSHIYLRGRNDLSDNPLLLRNVAHTLYDVIDELSLTHGPQTCLIGIPTAGSQLAQAVSHISFMRDHPPMCFRSMRSVLKTHGKDDKWIGDADLTRHSYVTLENVVSTADSMLKAFERIAPEGYPVKEMHHVVFADWELGGLKNLAAADYHHVHVRYVIRDIIAAFVSCGRWPIERWDYIEPKLAEFRAA
jgi:orotate phosphoribosyltransferase